MTTVTLRFDDKTKAELDSMVDEMGMTLTTFFMIYAKRALRERRIPFEISALPSNTPASKAGITEKYAGFASDLGIKPENVREERLRAYETAD